MHIYKNWIIENQNAVNNLLEEEFDYWLSQVEDETDTMRVSGVHYNTTLTVALVHKMLNIDAQNKIIASLIFSLYQITNQQVQVIFREGHGRHPLMNYDISDAIGWFTCKYPTKYTVAEDSLSKTLAAVADCNNAVINGGAGYDVLRYFGPGYINKQLECPAGILFNYLGDLTFDTSENIEQAEDRLLISAHSGFSSTMEDNGNKEGESLFQLNVNAWIENDALHCNLDIARSLGLEASECDRFIKLVQSYLKELIGGDQYAPGNVTPFQKGLISYVFSHPESNSYINQNIFETGITTSYEFFYQVCSILTTKYDILRTCYGFDYKTGEFTSTVLPAGTLTCEYFELQTDADADELRNLLTNIKLRKFKIEEEPLIRFSLIKTAGDKNIIAITSHHIIIDGTSVLYLLNELLHISEDLKAGRKILTSIPDALKFSTYAEWINSKNENEAISYWKNLLKNTTPCLLEEKTIGEPGSAENSFDDTSYRFSADSRVSAVLKSKHITLAAALNYLVGFIMARYIGKDSFTWGNTVTVRPFELDGMETIVGPCIATIPVTIDFNSDANILDEIKALQIQLIESQEYAYVTLNDIYRSTGHQQLFSVAYVYQNFMKSDFDEAQSDAYQSYVSTEGNISAHFPINILLFENNDELTIKVKYRKDYFAGYVIKDICHAIATTFNNLYSIKDVAVKKIDSFKIAALRSSWLGGVDTDLSAITLHDAFIKSSKEYPHKIAVIDSNKQVSYLVLDGMSNRICKLLVDHHILGPVGIRMKRSANLIAVIIGILKAGCTVVSLEHDFPEEKIAWINENIGLLAVFKDAEANLKINSRIFNIDTIDQLNEYSGLANVSPSALCCINYTSGSTGVPKLVKISHKGHVNRVLWLKDTFPATGDDIYGFKTLLCFGPSLREIFEPLIQGSTLFVYSDESNNNPELFDKETRQYQVTRLFLTPTFIRLLYDFELHQALARLNYLEISGEPIPVELYEKLRTAFPLIRIVGRYGATEAPGTVYYTLDDYGHSRNLPLGKPIYNTSVVISNEKGDILPVGVIGEIGISGDSISTGYINKELEIGSFAEISGKMHIKTGDLGYVNHHGILVFQTRKTRMIKIRGFRVEPAEIEFNLVKHPSVSKAIVVPVLSKNNTKIIVFYIKTEAIETAELRSFLVDRLPGYMIPHEFIEISNVPLTESGKVDYVSLSGYAVKNVKEAVRPPAEGIEKDIFEIISRMVDHVEFDVLSNFLEIGMDSILVLKSVYSIRKLFAVEISVADIYMHPTVKDFSAFLWRKMNDQHESADNGCYFINYNEKNEFLFFVPPIGNSQIDLKTLESAVPDEVTLVILKAVSAEESSNLSLEKIASDYVNVIKRINKGKKVNLSGWSLGATIAYEMAVQLERIGVDMGALLLFDPGFYSPEYDMNLTKDKISNILNGLMERNEAVDEEIKEIILTDMLTANQLIVNYKPTAYSGQLKLFKPAHISKEERNYDRKMNGLDQYQKEGIDVTTLAGNHMSMLGDVTQNKKIIKEFVLTASYSS